jgi:hypothetical protein
MIKQKDDYDSPWKMAMSIYFEYLLAFFFPEIHQSIDWSKPYEFLDQELQQVMRDDQIGLKKADKLVKVWLVDGTETWILLHLEVQSQYQVNFAERVYVYNSRIFGIFGKKVVSLVILADDQPSWRPRSFEYKLFGCRVLLEFPIVKLLDYANNWEELEKNSNPFAIIVMAHLKTQATRKLPQERLKWKLSIFKSLYQKGYNKNDIMELFRVLDWMMKLPKSFDSNFNEEVKSYQEENQMGYVPSIVRVNRVDQIHQDIKKILELRFNEKMPQEIFERLECFEDEEQLDLLLTQAVTTFSMETFMGFMDGIEPIQDW